MSWIKTIGLNAIIVAGTILFLDAVSYIGFKGKLSTILPGYGQDASDVGRGYPRFHFAKDADLGYDIAPNFKTSTYAKPAEYGLYDVWGNEHACFDDEWRASDAKGGVYLAGDSFTWGYARHETKFGTLLEKQIGEPVFACGVTHSGQRHQFEKFKRLDGRAINPKTVIVNVFRNDVANDFFFPNATVIDGFMVENIDICDQGVAEKRDGEFSFARIDENALKQRLEVEMTKREESVSLKSMLKKYSMSANVVATLTRGSRSNLNMFMQDELSCKNAVDVEFETLDDQYAESPLSEKNRLAIEEWIVHSKARGYRLVFSFIPSKDPALDVSYRAIGAFIASRGGEARYFDDYINERDLDRSKLYFRTDGHFNEYGNERYADYLQLLLSAK